MHFVERPRGEQEGRVASATRPWRSTQTLDAMERDYIYPSLANRDEPRTWQTNGAPDSWQVAKIRAQKILADHHPEYLSSYQDHQIRSQHKILS